MMRRVLSLPLVLFVCLCLPAMRLAGQAPSVVLVTGHFSASPGSAIVLRWDLMNCATSVPRVFGVGTVIALGKQMTADATGFVSDTIWPNDVINCGGVTGQTRWQVTRMLNRVPVGPPVCYNVLAAQNVNLDTATPCTQMSPPTPPGMAKDGTFQNLTVLGTLLATFTNLEPRSLFGYEIHLRYYPGATVDVQPANAQTAVSGSVRPHLFVVDDPGTYTGNVTLAQQNNLEFRGSVTFSNGATLGANGSNHIFCAPGVVPAPQRRKPPAMGGDCLSRPPDEKGCSYRGRMKIGLVR